MRNIKLTIEYDGTAYCGWQAQPNGVSVQEMLQVALRKMTGEKTMLQGASRTDAGVHALGQAANFRTRTAIPCRGFIEGLNSLLPEDISVIGAEEVPEGFHAKRSSKGKHYRYLIAFGGSRPALMRNRVWFIRDVAPASGYGAGASRSEVLDRIAELNEAAQVLVGEHDFSAFCGAGDTNRSKVRRIDRIEVRGRELVTGKDGDVLVPLSLPSGSNLLSIDITGNGFLKYMVRNIAGTLAGLVFPVQRHGGPAGTCDRKRISGRERIKYILDSGDRKKAGVTAPAFGLYLIEVYY